jgi:gliding motility-associated protein GldL
VISGADSEESEQKITGYVQQMEQLNHNLSGLNEFYEVHLSGLRSQMETIHLINAGLNRIREMYDSSVVDSSAFRAENERMAQLLAQLNLVYSRLLQAMTVNSPTGGGMPYNPTPYPGQAYPQPPYGQMR